METNNHSLNCISDLEIEAVNNFIIERSFQIIEEETDCFFNGKAELIDGFAEELEFSKLNPSGLMGRFHKAIYPPGELEAFISTLEKRIGRDLEEVCFYPQFKLRGKVEDLLDLEDSFLFIAEAARTFNFSRHTAKSIGRAWRKAGRRLGLIGWKSSGLGSAMGEYCLSTVGLSPKEIGNGIRMDIKKRIRGILKQNRLEIISHLKNEIIAQILYEERLGYASVLRFREANSA